MCSYSSSALLKIPCSGGSPNVPEQICGGCGVGEGKGGFHVLLAELIALASASATT